MKRLLFILLCTAGMPFTSWAQTATIDFTTNTWGLPEGSSNKATQTASFTHDGYMVTLACPEGGGYYFNQDGYLLFGKQGATLKLSAFNFDVQCIEVIGRAGASSNTLENIYVDDVAVSSECKGATGTNVFNIATDYQKSGNIYTLQVNSKHNAQVTLIKVYATNEKVIAAPIFEFEGGLYTEAFKMKITTDTEGAEIYYTTDGSTPSITNGIKLTKGYVEINYDMTLKAIAAYIDPVSEKITYSAITSAQYAIQKGIEFKRTTHINTGTRYLIAIEDNNIIAQPHDKAASYGYIYTKAVSIDNNTISEAPSYAYTIEVAQSGYTIKDSYGRYLYMKDSHDSFNVSTELPSEGATWSISFNSEGEAIINNTLKNKTIQYSTQYGSFGAYPDERGIYPTLYSEETEKQPTTQYYDAIDGKRGYEVKTILQDAIDEHTQRTYANLWTDFRTTDCRADGKVWDMYSGSTNYVFGDDQSKGGDSGEGSSYNREHSLPKSWFGGEVYPMYTDLFHLYPTDSYINQMRSNYPFGEVNTIKKQSEGGFSKLGTCAVSGYSGTVFEPADEYKGDFARTYFYMVTRYESQIATWKSDMLAGNAYPAFTQWAITMLLNWHREDPVSEKEIKRNEAVYTIQKNRNPYIDYPVLAEFVWGELTEVSVDISKLVLHSNEYDLDEDTDTFIKETSTSESGAIIYDLTGRQVTHPTQGIYIVNGKKRIAL